MISLKCLSFLYISSYLQTQARSVIAVISYGNDVSWVSWVTDMVRFGRFFVLLCIFLCQSLRLYIYIYSGGKKRLWHSFYLFYSDFAFVETVFHTHTRTGTKVQGRMWSSNLLSDNQKKNSVKRILRKWKHTKKMRCMDAAAGSKLVTKISGSLVYVCFIKHLFLVLFLAALAAGCQQGSWFESPV